MSLQQECKGSKPEPKLTLPYRNRPACRYWLVSHWATPVVELETCRRWAGHIPSTCSCLKPLKLNPLLNKEINRQVRICVKIRTAEAWLQLDLCPTADWLQQHFGNKTPDDILSWVKQILILLPTFFQQQTDKDSNSTYTQFPNKIGIKKTLILLYLLYQFILHIVEYFILPSITYA